MAGDEGSGEWARDRASPGGDEPIGLAQTPSMHEVGEPFESFYEREFPNLVALAAATTGDRSAAEDIAQEALAKTHRKWVTVSQYDRPGAFARRVTINLSLNARQRRTVELKAKLRLRGRVNDRLPPSSVADDHVWDAVRLLPGNQRAAIALHYLEDRPVAEIADILGCSPSTAKVHLHRGRTALAQHLGGAS